MNRSVRSITTLLFDWDGTLVDSAHAGFAAFQKTFEVLGISFQEENYNKTYSPNWYSMYEALELPKEKWQMADELWIRHYAQERVMLVEGAAETLRDLRGKSYYLGIVSSGSSCRVGNELNLVGLSAIFQVVVCNEHLINKKPHPEGLETAMRMLKIQRQQACYIGDSPEDVMMGKSANVLTVGVRSAYPSSRRLISAQPDIYLESITELSGHFLA
jgi:pyrophosphatase PpaX